MKWIALIWLVLVVIGLTAIGDAMPLDDDEL